MKLPVGVLSYILYAALPRSFRYRHHSIRTSRQRRGFDSKNSIFNPTSIYSNLKLLSLVGSLFFSALTKLIYLTVKNAESQITVGFKLSGRRKCIAAYISGPATRTQALKFQAFISSLSAPASSASTQALMDIGTLKLSNPLDEEDEEVAGISITTLSAGPPTRKFGNVVEMHC